MKRGLWVPGIFLVLLIAGVAAYVLGLLSTNTGRPPKAGAVAVSLPPETPSLLRDLGLIRPSRVEAARDFAAPTPDGGSLRLADQRGKVILLNFWATWCPPCLQEMPAMERLYRRYRDRGFMVLAASVDAEGDAVVTPFLQQHRLTFPVVLDRDMAVAERYGVRALPSTFLVDRGGNVVAMALGPREWDGRAARVLVESLLR